MSVVLNQHVKRIFLSTMEIKKIIKDGTIINKRPYILPHGQREDGTYWMNDIAKEDQEWLEKEGYRITEDWPHAGNGHGETYIVELWWPRKD